MSKYILTMPGAPHGLPCDIGIEEYNKAEPENGKLSPSCEFDFIADQKVRDWLWSNVEDRALDAISGLCCAYVEQLGDWQCN